MSEPLKGSATYLVWNESIRHQQGFRSSSITTAPQVSPWKNDLQYAEGGMQGLWPCSRLELYIMTECRSFTLRAAGPRPHKNIHSSILEKSSAVPEANQSKERTFECPRLSPDQAFP
ncbi:unnamed protein product [Calypogeia fissa]